ncbi:hypothetical protein BJ322DRAFT_1114761 [Thelephora terrestris]|uniref:JmjC domain-containing protein n=1 Tax=Thelephora terrestris TaxID=56493 RepID=A0A9P6L0V6_9AGAM|nr:hypothetical protein BJ322DRAFT_1114761 [Thelephora terrestris]
MFASATMIRTSRTKQHNKKPYHRVQVPQEILEQMDRIATESASRENRGTPSTTGDLPGRRMFSGRGNAANIPEDRPGASMNDTLTTGSASSSLNRTVPSSPKTSNTIQLADDVTVEAIDRTTREAGSGASWTLAGPSHSHTATASRSEAAEIRPIQLPVESSASSSRRPGVCQVPSSSHQVVTSAPSSIDTSKAIVDVEKLRLDLKELLEEFVARANEVCTLWPVPSKTPLGWLSDFAIDIDGLIGKKFNSQHTMAANDIDIESILSTSDTFRLAPRISFATPVDEITRIVTEYEQSGVPCVITGFPLVEGDEQSPLRKVEEWMDSIYANRSTHIMRSLPTLRSSIEAPTARADVSTDAHNRGNARSATGITLPCPPEWHAWLRDSYLVPGCLRPWGENDLLTESMCNEWLKLSGPDSAALFQDESRSTVRHDLLFSGGTDAAKHWFMTAEEDWPQVTENLRERNGSNVIRVRSMSVQELKEAPHNIYVYTQKKGDLVILPPEGWSHPGWDYLQLTIHPVFPKISTKESQQAYVFQAAVPYHPQKIIVFKILDLCNKLGELKGSQPDDPSLLAISETLKNRFILFDEVINSSHCSQDELLPTLDLGSCVRDNTTGDLVDCKILICSYCFIDGRACLCGNMKPWKTQPLAELMEIRTRIANLLGVSDEILDPQEHCVFDAAKALCDIKAEEQSVDRACSIPPAPSHRVPKSLIINCQGCHANRCYKHVLSTYHIHSAQALRAVRADTTSTLWHNLHKEMKSTYPKNYLQLKAAVKNGLKYPLVNRLAFYASNFAPAAPLNQAVALGFYDMAENGVQEVTHSISRSTSVFSLTGVEDGIPRSRQLRRRNSSFRQASTVAEGSTLQKRTHSPPEEGPSKRSRMSKPSDKQVMGTIQEEMLGRNQKDNHFQGAMSHNDADSSKEGSASHPHPEHQRANRNSLQDDQPSSPLHHPLEFFDPDTDLAARKPDSSKSQYNSAFEKLLHAQVTDVPGSDSNSTPAAEQAILGGPSSIAAPRLFLPSRLEPHEVRAPVRPAPSNTQGVPTLSAFSFQISNRSSQPSHRGVFEDDRSLRQIPASHRSDERVVGFTPPPTTQAPAQRNPFHRGAFEDDRSLRQIPASQRSDERVIGFTPPPTTQPPAQPTIAPLAPSVSLPNLSSRRHSGNPISGNYLSSENLQRYAEIQLESAKEWEGTVFCPLEIKDFIERSNRCFAWSRQ